MTKKVFWDKGHGGNDPGAVANGLQEKILVHKIVEYGMDYLKNNYTGFEQRTSRTGDQTLSLSQRSNLANNWGADAFVSVHINAGGGTGFETFVHNGGTSAATQSLQNMLHPEILNSMRQHGSIADRGKKRANFAVLRQTNMPAVLTENLFIDSNDHKHLKDETFLKTVGEAHARGMAKFLGLKSKTNEEEKKTVTKSVQIKTGGLTPEMVEEVTKYFQDKGWWAQIQFTADDKNPRALTGGLDPSMRQDFEAWLKERNWWYEIV